MSDTVDQRVKQAGLTAWRTAILLTATVIAVGMFLGLGYLVYVGEMSEGPLILYAGVILGYLLRSVMDLT